VVYRIVEQITHVFKFKNCVLHPGAIITQFKKNAICMYFLIMHFLQTGSVHSVPEYLPSGNLIGQVKFT